MRIALIRYERLRRGLEACAILVGSAHAVHLAGYTRYLSGPVALVATVDGRRTLVVPRYELAAAEESGRGRGRALWLRGLPRLRADDEARRGLP